MGKRFLLAAGLIIALVVPSGAFGVVGFSGLFPMAENPHHNGVILMGAERVNGENKRVKYLEFYGLGVNCPKSGPTDLQTDLTEPNTGYPVRTEIAIDAAVQHRKWHFNDLVPAAVGRTSAGRLDAWINFRGKFRKHNKNKADGTVEVTLAGVDFGSGPENCHGVQVFHVRE